MTDTSDNASGAGIDAGLSCPLNTKPVLQNAGFGANANSAPDNWEDDCEPLQLPTEQVLEPEETTIPTPTSACHECPVCGQRFTTLHPLSQHLETCVPQNVAFLKAGGKVPKDKDALIRMLGPLYNKVRGWVKEVRNHTGSSPTGIDGSAHGSSINTEVRDLHEILSRLLLFILSKWLLGDSKIIATAPAKLEVAYYNGTFGDCQNAPASNKLDGILNNMHKGSRPIVGNPSYAEVQRRKDAKGISPKTPKEPVQTPQEEPEQDWDNM
jgi:hypothetical protein